VEGGGGHVEGVGRERLGREKFAPGGPGFLDVNR
jgi:hypothetical protein